MKYRVGYTATWVSTNCPWCRSRKEAYGIGFRDGKLLGCKCLRCGSTRRHAGLIAEAALHVGGWVEKHPVEARVPVIKPCTELLIHRAQERWPAIPLAVLQAYVGVDEETPLSLYFTGTTVQTKETVVVERPVFSESGLKCITYGAPGPCFPNSVLEGDYEDSQTLCIAEGIPSALAMVDHYNGDDVSVLSLQGVSNASHPDVRFAITRSKSVILGLDADPAGRRALLEIGALCLELGVYTRVVRLPEGKDPADEVGSLVELKSFPTLVELCLA